MSNALSVTDLGTTIRDRVRLTLIDAIPDNKIEELIQAEFKSFFRDHSGYQGQEPPPFIKLLRNEISTQMQEAVRDYIRNQIQHQYLDQGRMMVSELAKELAPEILRTTMSGMAEQILQQLKRTNY